METNVSDYGQRIVNFIGEHSLIERIEIYPERMVIIWRANSTDQLDSLVRELSLELNAFSENQPPSGL